MDGHAVKEIRQEHGGRVYAFPIGVLAGNVETDEEHRFITDEEKRKFAEKVTVDEALSKNSANPVQNRAVAEALGKINETMGGKADILTVNRTVHISPGGNDATGDGTGGNPWRSFQHALENVPVINGNYEYTVSVAAGQYEGFIAKNVSATVMLQGDVTVSPGGRTYAIEIDDSNIKVSGEYAFNVNGAAGSLFYIHNGGRLNAFRTIFKLTGDGGGTGVYLVSDGGFSQTDGRMSFNNLDTAVRVGTNAVFYADALYGSYLTNGLVVTNGGRAAYDANSMSATNPVTTASGGRVYTGVQE